MRYYPKFSRAILFATLTLPLPSEITNKASKSEGEKNSRRRLVQLICTEKRKVAGGYRWKFIVKQGHIILGCT